MTMLLRAKRALKYLLVGCAAITVLLVVFVGICMWMSTDSGTIKLSDHHPFRSPEAKERYLKLYDTRAEEWPVASEIRMVETSYGPTLVRISGPAKAPALVLLHGFGGNSLQWTPNVESLSESFKVCAVDNIGDYGRSVRTRTLGSSDDYTKWLDDLLNSLEPGDRVNLIGLSYGGWLTAQYALRAPERLHKIVLLAPAGTVLPLRMQWILRAVLCMLPHRLFTESFMYWLLEDLVHKDEASRRMVDEWVSDSFVAVRSFAAKSMVKPTVLTDSELQSIKTPALFLVGANEKIYSAQEAMQRLKSVAPHIRTEVVPNAGHDLTVVQRELVNQKVLEFLGESDRQSR